jgi:hypothetical protein
MIKTLTKTRLDVELVPGISAFVRSFESDLQEHAGLPLEYQEGPQSQFRVDRNSISREFLLDIERVVEALSRIVRSARVAGDARPTGRKKRR